MSGDRSEGGESLGRKEGKREHMKYRENEMKLEAEKDEGTRVMELTKG